MGSDAEIDLKGVAAAAVKAPAVGGDDDGSKFSMDDLRGLLASSQLTAATPARRGAARLSDMDAPKASAQAPGAITGIMKGLGNVSEFTGLMRDSGTLAKLDAAAANGQEVTVFAPSNMAMAQMPNMALVKMKRMAEHEGMRDSFAKQHSVLDMNKEYTMASAQFGLGNVGAAIESLQDGAHISIQEDTDSPLASAQLAVQHDDEGSAMAASRIEASYHTPQGHTVHILSQALA